jgi:hypothetical protein
LPPRSLGSRAEEAGESGDSDVVRRLLATAMVLDGSSGIDWQTLGD